MEDKIYNLTLKSKAFECYLRNSRSFSVTVARIGNHPVLRHEGYYVILLTPKDISIWWGQD